MATFHYPPPYASGTKANASERWDRPYGFAHYLIMSNEERIAAGLADIEGLTDPLKDLPNIPFPTLPNMGTLPDPSAGLPAAPAFASVPEINIPAAPAAPAISGITADPAPVFNPTPVTVNLPSAPAPIVTGAAPTAPTLTDVSLPALSLPTLPYFDPSTLPAVLAFSYTEPNYTPAVANELRLQILAWLKGGTGLPAAVEQALFTRAYDRQEQINYREEQRIRADWASRGWQLPPGAMGKQIQAVREQGMLQTSETAREILIKAAEWEIENLRQAVSQGMAFEKLLIDHFHQIANRAFEVAKTRVEADVARLNAEIAAHNLSVTYYEAQVKAATLPLEVAKIQVDINKARIEAYRADISAWAEKIAARKIEFDAYETQVKAETAKIGLLETEAKAFAATVEAYKSGNDVKIQTVKIQIEQLDAAIKRHNLLLDTEKAKVQAKVAQLTAQTDRYKTELSAYSTVTEAQIKLTVTDYEAKIKQYEAQVSRLIQQAHLQMEALKAAAQIQAQLVAGAMSSTSISANISAGVGNQVNETHSYTKDLS